MKTKIHLMFCKIFTTISVVATFLFSNADAQRITVTIAGNGIAGTTGDGGLAKSANISSLEYLCTDPFHNVYFVQGSTIRKVSNKGIITTIAGGGTSTADGIPATSASIAPSGICADGVGNIFLITGGNKIKKIDVTTNLITTFAGTGSYGFTGDGGPATSATFNSICGICTNIMGDIVVADRNNNRIRKISSFTGIVTTIAGTGISGYTGDGGPATAATLYAPNYICTNLFGDIYFTDQYGSWIRSIAAGTGAISTYAGGGSSITECNKMDVILNVSGMCFDGSNNLCWNETSCSCRRIDHFSDSVHYLAGDYSMESFKDDTNSLYAWMNTNMGLAVDAEGDLYVADNGNSRIRKIIKLTSTPTFEYGRMVSINPCPGYPFQINTQLGITDLNMGETETWSVVTPPTAGTLSGFPATAVSCGVLHSVFPAGLSYTAPSAYTGADSFRIRVSDGTLSDTVTVYVSVQMATPGTTSGTPHVCETSTTYLNNTASGGVWSVTNSNASVSSSGYVTGLTAGIDTVIYSLSVPCPLSAFTVITVNPMPNAGVITGVDSVCVGAMTTLSDTVLGGVWNSSSSYYATVSSSGVVTGVSYTYGYYYYATISYTVSNTWCTAEADRTIKVNAAASAISGSNTICGGATLTMYEYVTGGTWNLTNGNAVFASTLLSGIYSEAILSGVSYGIDTLTYTNSNYCGTETVSQIISVNPASSAGIISGPSYVCLGSTITLSSAVSGGYWNSTHYLTSVGFMTGTVVGTTVGVDSIVYSVYGACDAMSSYIVSVLDTTISSSPIVGAASVCEGSSITFTDAISGGVWSVTESAATISGSGTLTGVLSGIDTVNYLISNACASTMVSSVINILGVPDAGVISGGDSLCVGAALVLSETVGGGTWSSVNPDVVVSGGSVTGMSSGVDTVVYSVTNSCGTNIATTPVYVRDCITTETKEIKTLQVEIYPNPAASFINVDLGRVNGAITTVTVQDVTGRTILRSAAASDLMRIDVSNFPNGVYMVRVDSGIGYFTDKIVVNR